MISSVMRSVQAVRQLFGRALTGVSRGVRGKRSDFQCHLLYAVLLPDLLYRIFIINYYFRPMTAKHFRNGQQRPFPRHIWDWTLWIRFMEWLTATTVNRQHHGIIQKTVV